MYEDCEKPSSSNEQDIVKIHQATSISIGLLGGPRPQHTTSHGMFSDPKQPMSILQGNSNSSRDPSRAKPLKRKGFGKSLGDNLEKRLKDLENSEKCHQLNQKRGCKI